MAEQRREPNKWAGAPAQISRNDDDDEDENEGSRIEPPLSETDDGHSSLLDLYSVGGCGDHQTSGPSAELLNVRDDASTCSTRLPAGASIPTSPMLYPREISSMSKATSYQDKSRGRPRVWRHALMKKIDTIVKISRHVILHGKPGIGKTELVVQYAKYYKKMTMDFGKMKYLKCISAFDAKTQQTQNKHKWLVDQTSRHVSLDEVLKQEPTDISLLIVDDCVSAVLETVNTEQLFNSKFNVILITVEDPLRFALRNDMYVQRLEVPPLAEDESIECLRMSSKSSRMNLSSMLKFHKWSQGCPSSLQQLIATHENDLLKPDEYIRDIENFLEKQPNANRLVGEGLIPFLYILDQIDSQPEQAIIRILNLCFQAETIIPLDVLYKGLDELQQMLLSLPETCPHRHQMKELSKKLKERENSEEAQASVAMKKLLRRAWNLGLVHFSNGCVIINIKMQHDFERIEKCSCYDVFLIHGAQFFGKISLKESPQNYKMLPHMLHVLKRLQQGDNLKETQANLLHDVAWLFHTIGNFSLAVHYAKQGLDLLGEQVCDNASLRTLSIKLLIRIGHSQVWGGNYTSSAENLQKALQLCEGTHAYRGHALRILATAQMEKYELEEATENMKEAFQVHQDDTLTAALNARMGKLHRRHLFYAIAYSKSNEEQSRHIKDSIKSFETACSLYEHIGDGSLRAITNVYLLIMKTRQDDNNGTMNLERLKQWVDECEECHQYLEENAPRATHHIAWMCLKIAWMKAKVKRLSSKLKDVTLPPSYQNAQKLAKDGLDSYKAIYGEPHMKIADALYVKAFVAWAYRNVDGTKEDLENSLQQMDATGVSQNHPKRIIIRTFYHKIKPAIETLDNALADRP